MWEDVQMLESAVRRTTTVQRTLISSRLKQTVNASALNNRAKRILLLLVNPLALIGNQYNGFSKFMTVHPKWALLVIIYW